MKTAEEILAQAAELVEAGWAQGDGSSAFSAPDKTCAVLALSASGNRDFDAYAAARRALHRELGVTR